MKRSTLFVLCALTGSIGFAMAVVEGCGSEEPSSLFPDASAGDAGVKADAPSPFTPVDGGLCALFAQACTKDGDCCSRTCDLTTKVCAKSSGACKNPQESCTSPTECCTLVCAGGQCGAANCISDQQACQSGTDCCGGKCDNGTCTPLNTSRKTGGNACAANTECCSKLCKGGRCELASSICSQPGDVCGKDDECCTGVCTKAAGATVGTCALPETIGGGGASQCAPAGVVCGSGMLGDAGVVPCTGSGTDCCSRSCLPWANSGVTICQPPTGCRPTGEICRSDLDCCGADGVTGAGGQDVMCLKANATDPVGRCTNGKACRGNGQICKLVNYQCSAENNCCAGNVNQVPSACKPDNLGIPRCTFAGACGDAGVGPDGGSLAGSACASSADCCGLPCVPNPAGTPPFICGAACVPQTGACTTSADCCSGLPCIIQPGASKGTCGSPISPRDGGAACSLYGQACSAAGDCCDGIPCYQGRCQDVPK